jgi:hypothetical protein
LYVCTRGFEGQLKHANFTLVDSSIEQEALKRNVILYEVPDSLRSVVDDFSKFILEKYTTSKPRLMNALKDFFESKLLAVSPPVTTSSPTIVPPTMVLSVFKSKLSA